MIRTTHHLVQGSAEWHQHRATHLNASDVPAMLGISSYKTRNDLLRERATGVKPEVDAGTQSRFDDGHRFEAMARPIAEQIIGEELFSPTVSAELDGLNLSASIDGITLAGETIWEHKTGSAPLIEAVNGPLPLAEQYCAQMEQQLLVSGAERCLFMASKGTEESAVYCWYESDPALRARIISGWKQFLADLADYKPSGEVLPAISGKAPDQLPALHIQVTGMVTASNLAEFKARAMTVLDGINRDLQSDEDFANAEQTVKWAKDAEDQLEAAKKHALSQTASIEELFRTIDDVSAETRRVRLDLDRLVKAKKESIRGEICAAGREVVLAHYQTINITLGQHAIGVPASLSADLAAAIKGKRTIASLRDAVDTAVASAKIEASQRAEAVRANVAILDGVSADHEGLFADHIVLCATKQPDDLRNLIKLRISEHEQREAARIEQDRERIRAEEAAKLRAQQEAQQNNNSMPPAATKPCDPNAGEKTPIRPDANGSADGLPAAGGSTSKQGARINLGEINARIAPLSITADGLAQLGFKSVGTERSAKLYAESSFPAMCGAIVSLVNHAATGKKAA